ncbi:MAG: NAD(P)H-dependent oxidoreductase [Proteobacteria bacterium]|nr:NAD(P)H-dependent oxidoreductase [Pseudomonadota bacterium]MBU1388408.1 NAD(P)H-dependent oxidoreductase [Pseudomonadota bacterium]MBU1542768.1 NAD(P)H-dependent oxidoreductase [Pseudomonadota bacterium]MBU2430993.1 NAD(P)H-dependent oxidoreductase [Pseudomonadota bacterium]MBU2480153.1 NAD(P)H-dependent oxidoreductase [Pseudomonadota bacterium]
MTHILAFQGSPRGKNGNTDAMLQQFLESAESAGAQTQTIYLKDYNIHPETELAAQKLPFSPEDFFTMANSAWDKKIEEAKTE